MCHTLHHPAEVAFNIEHYLCECICVLCVAALYFHNLFHTSGIFPYFCFSKTIENTCLFNCTYQFLTSQSRRDFNTRARVFFIA
jgi:hypothetical protein